MGAIWSTFVGFLEWLLLQFSILTGSAGIGIILFTIVARLAILPLTLSSLRSSRKMQELQPLIKDLQRKYGKDQQKLQEETLKLYRDRKINPAGSCLPLFLQLPIFFGVYQAVSHLMIPEWQKNLSPGVQTALQDPTVAEIFARPFLGLNLGVAPFHNAPDGWQFAGFVYLILPVLSVVLQFVQQIMATPRVQDPQQKAMMQAMMFMPLIFGYIAFTFPTGAVLYWVASSVIGVIQQYFISGWGSLANYLKFLPPDRVPAAGLALATPAGAPTTSPSSELSEEDPGRERMSFWDVLKPLTESNSVETVPVTPTGESERKVEQALEQARTQNRPQNTNLRRIRKRR